VAVLEQCGTDLRIVQGGTEIWSSSTLTKKHGKVTRSFKSNDEDLSLHYLAKGKLTWHREEGLAQIKQVEVFDKENTPQEQKSTRHEQPAYVARMGDKIELAEVPSRIIQRYLGNF
jgi:hypothetical protein